MIHRTKQGVPPSSAPELGRSLTQIGDVWIEYSGAVPTAAELEAHLRPPPTFAELKEAKATAFITEGVTRVAIQVPDWDTLDTIKTVAGLWTSHLAANATVAQVTAKDIYLYVRDTVPAKLAAVTDQATLDAIDPTDADPFGDGTLWPT